MRTALLLPTALLPLFLVACGDKSTDEDGDGFTADEDCDDADADVNPDAVEVCNGVDDDCNNEIDDDAQDAEVYYADLDGDGAYGDLQTKVACEQPEGFGFIANDCDDEDLTRYPGAGEACDGVDNDCDEDVPRDEEDGDGDGFMACEECDDNRASVYPGAQEACNGRDDDCDGTTDEEGPFYTDADGDGFGAGAATSTIEECGATVPGLADNADDCDDTDAAVNPDAQEVCDNLDVDEDCDGDADDADSSADVSTMTEVWPDGDGDGYGDMEGAMALRCDTGTEYAVTSDDCDDSTDLANPGITVETCGDGIDNDCDGKAVGCGPWFDPSVGDSDGIGSWLEPLGDVDGDGHDDTLTWSGGQRHLVYGSWSGDISSSPPTGSVAIDTSYIEGVPGGADIDGDGYADLLFANTGIDEISVIYGPVTMDDGSRDAVIASAVDGYRLQGQVWVFGDRDGDGDDDIVWSQRQGGGSGDEIWSGVRCYSSFTCSNLFPGTGRGDVNGDGLMDVPYNVAVSTSSGGGSFVSSAGGTSRLLEFETSVYSRVTIIGDVTGDGYDDVAIGNARSTDAGAIYIIDDLSMSTPADVAIVIEGTGRQRIGERIAPIGDVNGDGRPDILSVNGDDGTASVKQFLFTGPFSAGTHDASTLAESTIGLSSLTYDVVPAGDTNADGYDDFFVGGTYLFLGGPGL